MHVIKNFIKKRSKILFFSSIISVILFILLIPEFLSYSEFVKAFVKSSQHTINVTNETLGEVIWSTHSNEIFHEFNIIFSCLYVFVALFNVVGYIYRKTEFIFISIGLGVVITCMSIYVSNTVFVVLIALCTILNIMGYIEQNILEKS